MKKLLFYGGLSILVAIPFLAWGEPKKRTNQKTTIAEEVFKETSTVTPFEKRIQAKMTAAEDLVNEAIPVFKKLSIGNACRTFEKEKKWRRGDLFVAVFSDKGVCYLHDNQPWLIWEKVGVSDAPETPGRGKNFIPVMLEKGTRGGWVSYEWDYASRYAYVKTVIKQGKTYIIAAGFFPDSPKFMVQQLVQSAIRFGKQNGASLLFQQISNPKGQFTRGDLYLWAYDMNGVVYAHPNIGFVGQSRLDWKDGRGRYRNKMMIDIAKRDGSGWITYDENGIEKEAYFEVLVDQRSAIPKTYIVGGGYYPTVNDETVRTFVTKAVNYLKANGPAITIRDVTSYSGGFTEGPLRIFIYDFEGTMLADGSNPQLIGQNLIGSKDAEGKYITKGILELVGATPAAAAGAAAPGATTVGSAAPTTASKGHGWFTFFENNMYKTVYVERVEIPDGKYVLGAGYWPASKEHTAKALAERAAEQLETKDAATTLQDFSDPEKSFQRGDLCVQVTTEDGICLVSGRDLERIWRDETKEMDSQGYPLFDKIQATASQGGGWVDLEREYGTYRAYVKLVSKKLPIEAEPEKDLSSAKEQQKIDKLPKPAQELDEASSVQQELAKEAERRKRDLEKEASKRRETAYDALMKEQPTLKETVVVGKMPGRHKKGYESYFLSVGYYL